MIIYTYQVSIQVDKFQRIFNFSLFVALFQTGNEKEYLFIFDSFISSFEYFISTYNLVAFF